jgi:chromosome segregation ATPase
MLRVVDDTTQDNFQKLLQHLNGLLILHEKTNAKIRVTQEDLRASEEQLVQKREAMAASLELELKLDAELKELRGRVAEKAEGVKALRRELSKVQAREQDLVANVEAANLRIQESEARVQESEARIQESEARIQDLSEREKGLEDSVLTLQACVQALEQEASVLAMRQMDAEGDVDAFRRVQKSRMHERIAVLRKSLVLDDATVRVLNLNILR